MGLTVLAGDLRKERQGARSSGDPPPLLERAMPLLFRLALVAVSVLPAVPQSTPGEVVKAFYLSCNAGEYARAEKLATTESVTFLKTTMSMAGSSRATATT